MKDVNKFKANLMKDPAVHKTYKLYRNIDLSY